MLCHCLALVIEHRALRCRHTELSLQFISLPFAVSLETNQVLVTPSLLMNLPGFQLSRFKPGGAADTRSHAAVEKALRSREGRPVDPSRGEAQGAPLHALWGSGWEKAPEGDMYTQSWFTLPCSRD